MQYRGSFDLVNICLADGVNLHTFVQEFIVFLRGTDMFNINVKKKGCEILAGPDFLMQVNVSVSQNDISMTRKKKTTLPSLSARKKLKTDSYFVISDSLYMELKRRAAVYVNLRQKIQNIKFANKQKQKTSS